MYKHNNLSRVFLVVSILCIGATIIGCSSPESTESTSTTKSTSESTSRSTPEVTNNSFPVVGSRTSYPDSLEEEVKKNPNKNNFPEIQICKTDSQQDPWFLIIGIGKSEDEAKAIQQRAIASPPSKNANQAWIIYPKDKIQLQKDSCKIIS
ncbi:MAG: hypothetical protein AN485_16685 [Anabaena sp. MDT14b]|jgi:hypothetical protein|nr:MAG: hypothetical protein AN485_16685 [Anabaena sp. MDT14b]